MADYEPGRALDSYEREKFSDIVDFNTTTKGRMQLVWASPEMAKRMRNSQIEEALILSFGTLWRKHE
jgi:hypothetical protein